jgi:molybdate transport system permease protein
LEAWLSEPLLLSFKIGLATVLSHLIFGVLLAYYLSGKKTLLKNIIDIFVTIPIVFPPIALGFVLLLLFGKNGYIGSVLHEVGVDVVFTVTGVFIASFIAGLPLVVKPIQSAIDEQARQFAEASYTLGKNAIQTLVFVILPNIKKVILASMFLGFGRSLGEVGITLMLGGDIIGKTDTLSLAIYNYAFGGEFDKAILLSIILGIISLILFFSLKKLAYL